MRVNWRFGLGRIEFVEHYAGVLVPLEEAHMHSHSARTGRVEFEAPDLGLSNDDDDDEEAAAGKHRGGEEEEREGMLQMDAAEYSIEGLRKAMRDGDGAHGPGYRWSEYEIKSKLINKAIQDIGMGTYNWQLFVLCGFGWFADNLWMQGVSLTLPSLSAEFGVDEKTVRYTTSACYVGLAAGSFLWGVGSDYLGRRIAFNMTLLVTSVFGVMAAYAQSWGGVCFFYAAFGFGVGGNLPVDGALFLEFLPDSYSSLLTLLSVWWPFGQLVSSLAAWYFIANWPVEQGWRYFIVTVGIVTFAMFAFRFFIFHLLESPKFLVSKGRQEEAVAVVHGLAYRNGSKTWLTSKILDEVAAEDYRGSESPSHRQRKFTSTIGSGVSLITNIRAHMRGFIIDRIRPLFKTKTLAAATTLIWFCWASIGMGYPLFNAFLPQYFARVNGGSKSSGAGAVVTRHESSSESYLAGETYRNYAITSVMGVPGSLLAAYLVDRPSPFLGRRGTLAGSTLLSAVFLFLFVLLGTTPMAQLFFSCVEAFSQNIMYGVLYAFTPEIFPAPVRGAGTGTASFLNRITGVVAPIIAASMPGDGASTPIYLSAVLILSSFVAMCLIPIETRGAQRL